MVAGEHVPDRLGELSGQVDLRDLRSALAAEALLGALVALGVDGVAAGVQRRFEQGPAQVTRALLGDRTAAVGGARLDSYANLTVALESPRFDRAANRR